VLEVCRKRKPTREAQAWKDFLTAHEGVTCTYTITRLKQSPYFDLAEGTEVMYRREWVGAARKALTS
jgi:hypothetical protein